MDATTKLLSESYNIPLVICARYAGVLVWMTVLFAPARGKELLLANRKGLVLVRSLSLALLSLFAGVAFQRMPVAETTAITFLSPILVVVAAGPLLGERIGRLGWIATLAGFAGVLLIARPSEGLDLVGVICALLAAATNVVYQLLSRTLAATERTDTMMFYTALIGSIVYTFALPWSWHGPTPTPMQAFLFVTLGIYSGVGHYLLTAAFRYAPASMLAPMTYVQLLWSGILGWVVFDHIPTSMSLVGMLVIAASGAMIGLAARRRPEARTVPVPNDF